MQRFHTNATQGGSSPLVRGQLFTDFLVANPCRIIPARAGPTRRRLRREVHHSDHPRSCGANTLIQVRFFCKFGSSPLVRGQLDDSSAYMYTLRIIPARAGPTQCADSDERVHADHPRSCGANPERRNHGTQDDGSSPLVRGQQTQFTGNRSNLRIIPARAGPTTLPKTLRLRKADHPRSCGANSLILRGKSGLSQIKIFDYSSGIWQ